MGNTDYAAKPEPEDFRQRPGTSPVSCRRRISRPTGQHAAHRSVEKICEPSTLQAAPSPPNIGISHRPSARQTCTSGASMP